MKIAYFDCFSGISGDMCLGALVDSGVPLKDIARELKKLQLKGWKLSETKVLRSGISATKVDVLLDTKKGNAIEGRRWKDIKAIVTSSSLPDRIKRRGLDIFRTLFEAEAKVHGSTMQRVHLHELGAEDCLVDIFGTLIGLDLLGIEAVFSSALNMGGGFVKANHGVLPVPAPATARLIEGVPVYSSDTAFELTTPTGAAVIRTIAKEFGKMPGFVPAIAGYGAGGREILGRPNVLRIMIGEMHDRSFSESIHVIETNIDDMNPQVYGYLTERLFEKGALDVFLTHIIMKKMRPGVMLSVLCKRDRADELIRLILKETSSIGVRCHETSRVTMDREIRTVNTRYGRAGVKVSSYEGLPEKYMPEYDDCAKLAREKDLPLTDVMEEVRLQATKKKRGV